MKKIGKNTKLYLIGMIIGGITLGITTVIADTIINSTSVAYKTTTVKAALDELYDIADFKEEVKDMLYPVGSIYISVSSTNPSQLFGGTWIKLSSGIFLQSTEIESELGTMVSAGLPNLTGRFSISFSNGSDFQGPYAGNTHNPTGVFRSISGPETATTFYFKDVTRGNGDINYTTFDASRSSSIYGNSATVQPPAMKVYMWRRTT